MTTLPLTWFEDDDPRDLRRWALAAFVVVGIHLAVICAYVYIHRPDEIGDDTTPVAVELAPSDDTVDQPAVAPVPEEQVKPIEQPPPPPDTSQAVVAPPPDEKPPEPIKEQKPPTPAMQARMKGSLSRDDASWRTAIAKHLAKHTVPYPGEAAARQEEGVVHLGFRVDHNGRVYNLHIMRSSGYADLDKAGLTMIERAQPFPPLPESEDESDTDLDFPLRFQQPR
jgi:protein TonB